MSKKLLKIPKNPNLYDFQAYVRNLELYRGFSDQSILDKCLLLGEELGELFKAIRKKEHIVIDKNSKIGTISEEISDIFILLVCIANRYNIDLEKAVIEKESKNNKRIWEKQ